MDDQLIDDLACDVRAQLQSGLSPLQPVSLGVLVAGGRVADMIVRVTTEDSVPFSVWAVTTFDVDRAWIWLNPAAWREFPDTPRTRFTVAHELGHVVLHGVELPELFVQPEPEHHRQIERDANRFAARLLIPDQAIKRFGHLPSDELGRRFGVSAMMAARRVEEWERR